MKTKNIFSMLPVTVKIIFAGLVAVGLQSCGGGGDSSSSPPLSNIFVGDSSTMSIGSSVNPNPGVGTTTVDRLIVGANTGLVPAMSSFALDASNDKLYVSNGSSIRVFDSAGTAAGNVTPGRIISTGSGGSPATAIFRSIYLDMTNNLLYATDQLNLVVRIYSSASTTQGAASYATLSGITAPSQLEGVAVDLLRDAAYVLDNKSPPVIHKIANAKTGGGTETLLTLSSGGAVDRFDCGIFVDSAHDRLFVSAVNGTIDIFDNVSTKSGIVIPDRTIQLPSAVRTKLAYDVVNNRLYGLAPNAIYIIDNASTVTGAVAAKMVTISGATSMGAIVLRP